MIVQSKQRDKKTQRNAKKTQKEITCFTISHILFIDLLSVHEICWNLFSRYIVKLQFDNDITIYHRNKPGWFYLLWESISSNAAEIDASAMTYRNILHMLIETKLSITALNRRLKISVYRKAWSIFAKEFSNKYSVIGIYYLHRVR